MIKLLKKDLAVYAMILLAAVALWTVGPAITWITYLLRDPQIKAHVGDYIDGMAFASFFVTAILGSALGGAAFAAEKRNKTADFLAMLPVSRFKIVASKLIVCVAILSALWALAFGSLILAASIDRSLYAIPPQLSRNPNDWRTIAAGMSFTVMVLSVGWFLSAILKDPLASTILAVLGIGLYMALVGYYLSNHPMTDAESFWMFTTFPVILGVLTWLAGTLYYLRRVEP